MPKTSTIEKAQQDAREGKAASTQAGEFVREEFHHIREGKHGARSARQAIAIGLSKARRAGIKLPRPGQGKASAKAARRQAVRDYDHGQTRPAHRRSRRRSRAVLQVLKHEGHRAGSRLAISRQTHQSAARRTAGERSASARKAIHTKTPAGLSAAARKAARTRTAATEP